MRKVQFADNYFYHIYNRGVDKRKTFMDSNDFRRFYAGLYLFNNANYHADTGRHCTKLSFVQDQIAQSLALYEPREPFVNVVSFCLMPNHYHLLLEQLQEGGITKFMHKLNTAYTNYFNKRYERTGGLLEGPFKAVLIKREGQFEHIPRYIHLNALDLTDMNWREGQIDNWHRAERFLEEYVWSSHHFYLGKPQQYPVVEASTVGKMFKTPDRYMHFLKQWSTRELTTVRDLSPFTAQS